MNRTKIEWTDFTWNPVTGCWGPGGTAEKPNRCAYCYAQKMAYRFWDRFKPTVDHPELWALRDPFIPHCWRFRLSEPSKIKKSSKIFVCSTSDIMGESISDVFIHQILNRALANPQHILQFLTKNPRRLSDFNPWPANCHVGTTVTNQPDADERLPWLLQVDAPVLFVSHEPLLKAIGVSEGLPGPEGILGSIPHPFFKQKYRYIQWAIIGAQTGPGAVKPKPEWVQSLIDQYRAAGVPIFMKNNLSPPMGRLVQEWPKP